MIALDVNTPENSVHGETPFATFFTAKSELYNAASKFVKTATDAGIEPNEIVFLTVETEKKSIFSDVTSINGINIASDFTNNSILFTTVRKFKGLEAKAVMIIDVSIKALTNPEKRRLAYVGCSRAKHLLKIAIYEDADSRDIGS